MLKHATCKNKRSMCKFFKKLLISKLFYFCTFKYQKGLLWVCSKCSNMTSHVGPPMSPFVTLFCWDTPLLHVTSTVSSSYAIWRPRHLALVDPLIGHFLPIYANCVRWNYKTHFCRQCNVFIVRNITFSVALSPQ